MAMVMVAMEEEMAAGAMKVDDSQKMKPATITLKEICKVNIYTYF
jgi:hypothetical protein